jgi:hypothetical protein
LKEIEDLELLVNEEMSRTEAKKLREKIDKLKTEKNKLMREVDYIEDKIGKQHLKIDKLNDQTFRLSLKVSPLGLDKDKNEYWFFKDDITRLYVRPCPPKKMTVDDDEGFEVFQEVEEQETKWFYYDEEEEIDELF